MAKPKPKQPTLSVAPLDNSLLESARDSVAKALASLDGCIDRVSADLKGSQYDPNAASHLAWLTKHVAQVLGELRKLEAHDRTIASKMTEEERDKVVQQYIADLPVERRAAVRAYLDTLDATGSVL